MSEYLKIVFQNIEPVRISDDSASQSGQTMTLRYIPGTALRGIVVNSLACSETEKDFKDSKKLLFSNKVRFMNAYLTDGDEPLFPSPKGFYEDKKEAQGKKAVENVTINGAFTEGNKRASLGRFCRVEGDSVCYYNVDTGSDLKIKINLNEGEKQNVFRNEYIREGYVFTGYIAVDDDGIKDRIKNVFAQDFILGNGRSAGMGKCKVISCEYADELPYKKYIPQQDQDSECYMMLLSNTVMRDENGEFCGLDMKKLEAKMGVSYLKIKFCATSTADVRGYNRTWQGRTPSVTMYEQGSVFHLKYSGTLTVEKMLSICNEGIGVRRNEGFGRVLFVDGYENIKYKEARRFGSRMPDGADKRMYPEDIDTLRIAARRYYRSLLERKMGEYVVKNPMSKGGVANSQLGAVEAFATAYKYQPKKAARLIREYLDHALDKEDKSNVQKGRNSIMELNRFVRTLLDANLDALLSVSTAQKGSVMGISKSELVDADAQLALKLELLIKMIRYDNKKEAQG